jgi:Ca2+-binding EF-hand superfamily protein
MSRVVVLTSPECLHATQRFDSNQSGALEPAQLKEFLTELNSQTPPTDEEVDALLGQADASKEVSADST